VSERFKKNEARTFEIPKGGRTLEVKGQRYRIYASRIRRREKPKQTQGTDQANESFPAVEEKKKKESGKKGARGDKWLDRQSLRGGGGVRLKRIK